MTRVIAYFTFHFNSCEAISIIVRIKFAKTDRKVSLKENGIYGIAIRYSKRIREIAFNVEIRERKK
jgi:hypothetical protein